MTATWLSQPLGQWRAVAQAEYAHAEFPEGASVLRRAGGHAYVDPAFEAMEGQRVRLRGRLRPNFFLVEGVDEPND